MMLSGRKNKKIGEILVESNVITPRQLNDALSRQKESGGRLGANLVELGHMREDEIAPYIAEQHRVPFISLDRYDIDVKISAIIPDEMISAYGVIPISLIRDIVTLAAIDVPSGETIERIERLIGYRAQVVMITKSDFDRYRKTAYNLSVVDKDKEYDGTYTSGHVDTPGYSGKERRRYPRFDLKITVKYEFKDEINVNPSVNISRGGVLIRSKSPVPVNAHIILRIGLPTSDEEVIAVSRVVRVEKNDNNNSYMIALSFSSMDQYDNKVLASFMESAGAGDEQIR